MSHTISHSRSYSDGGSALSNLIADTRDQGNKSQASIFEEMFGEASHTSLTAKGRIRAGPRNAMFKYLLALKAKFMEQGIEKMAADIDRVFQLDGITGDGVDEPSSPSNLVDAAELGRRGGLKGGPARARRMTPKERSESARKASLARWAKTA